MALPSQIGQGGSGARVSTAPRRDRNGRTIVITGAVVLVAAGALTWVLLRNKDTKLPTAAQPVTEATPSVTPGGTGPTGSSLEPAPVKPAEPSVSLLAQGSSKPATAPGPTPSNSPAVREPDPSGAPRVDGTKPPPTDLTRPGNPTVPDPQPSITGAPQAPPAPLSAGTTSAGVRAMIDDGARKLAAGDPIAARTLFNRALADSRTTRTDQDSLRERLTAINEDLIFSTKVTKGEPFTEEYVVQSGDNPTKIFRKRDLATEPKLIEKINKTDATKLRVGQKLKLVRGPFHAVVHKADFRLDLYAGSPDDPADWTYIRSYKVGLGENDGTPVGTFVVKSSSKLINPHWANPKTGEKFLADDPKNPIGERWIGIEGVGPAKQFTGFGLHGTIDPDSIGKQKSMGCVRMAAPDVERVYDLLTEKISIVRIEP